MKLFGKTIASATIAACLALGGPNAAYAAGAPGAACGKVMTPAQKTQRLLDIAEITNVASAHEYYHSAWMHQAEIENIWSAREDVSWTNNVDRYGNRKSFWGFYVDNLKNFPTHGTLAYHTLTTPIIEVAGDGKTAKAIFMSQGTVAGPGPGGAPAQAQWTAEKYGMDFIKENGVWKIWHLRTYVEFYSNVNGSPANVSDNQAAQETNSVRADLAKAGGTPAVAGTGREASGATFTMGRPTERKIFYEGYSTDRAPQYNPAIPAPYCTFSEVTAY